MHPQKFLFFVSCTLGSCLHRAFKTTSFIYSRALYCPSEFHLSLKSRPHLNVRAPCYIPCCNKLHLHLLASDMSVYLGARAPIQGNWTLATRASNQPWIVS